jgi:hypothetical protein
LPSLVPGDVLAAHRHAFGFMLRDRTERADDLDLLVADRVRIEVGRRLHGHEAEQLQHVVLQHVPQGAVFVVVGPAVADAEGLGHRDLDVVDRQAVPQRLEDGVAEAQGDQVLDRLLAEVVVDAEDLVLGEGVGDGVVDLEEGLEVPADGLLQHHAVGRLGQAGGLQGGDDAAVERGRDGEEAGHTAGGAHVADLVLERLQAGGIGGVDRQIVEAGVEPGPGGVRPCVVGLGLALDRGADLGDVFLAALVRAGRADDLQPVGQQAVVLEEIERRQQHPHGEIAAAAEQHQGRHALSFIQVPAGPGDCLAASARCAKTSRTS